MVFALEKHEIVRCLIDLSANWHSNVQSFKYSTVGLCGMTLPLLVLSWTRRNTQNSKQCFYEHVPMQMSCLNSLESFQTINASLNRELSKSECRKNSGQVLHHQISHTRLTRAEWSVRLSSKLLRCSLSRLDGRELPTYVPGVVGTTHQLV